MDELYVHALLKKFVENTLTADEHAALQGLLHDAKNDPLIYTFMDNVWDTLHTSIPFSELRAEAIYKKIYSDPRFIAAVPQKIATKNNRLWLKIAASVALVCVMGLIGGKFYLNQTAKPAYLNYQTFSAQRAKIKLPDGTLVWLNAGSHIRYPQDFMPNLREVYLDGEGFFDVVHDAAKPFVIHTHSLNIQVLGTAFNINTYSKDITAVTVARGKVGIKASNKWLGFLTPNQQLAYHSSTRLVERHDVNASLYTLWTQGELRLDNVTMAEAAEVISRWYGVHFVFKNAPLKSARFVVSFPKNADLHKVMNVVSKLNHFDYTIDHTNIYISQSSRK